MGYRRLFFGFIASSWFFLRGLSAAKTFPEGFTIVSVPLEKVLVSLLLIASLVLLLYGFSILTKGVFVGVGLIYVIQGVLWTLASIMQINYIDRVCFHKHEFKGAYGNKSLDREKRFVRDRLSASFAKIFRCFKGISV